MGKMIYWSYDIITFTLTISEHKLSGAHIGGFDDESKEKTHWGDYCILLKYVKFEGKVTPDNTYFWFYNCINLKEIDLTDLDTSHASDMKGMFYRCESLKNLDLTLLDTRHAENLKGLLLGCKHLDTFHFTDNQKKTGKIYGKDSTVYYVISKLIYWAIKDDTLMISDKEVQGEKQGSFEENQFETDGWSKEIKNIHSVVVKGKVKPKSTKGWFLGSNAVNFDLKDLDTSRTKDMSSMFQGCKKVRSLDLSSFDTSHVENMIGMFLHCFSLEHVDVSSFDTSRVQMMNLMFYKCLMLHELDISNFNMKRTKAMFHFLSKDMIIPLLTLPKDNGNGIKNYEDIIYGKDESVYLLLNNELSQKLDIDTKVILK